MFVEDQQRINTFSKLNTRFRSIEEKIEGLKVRNATSISQLSLSVRDWFQQEKEALDDLNMELELADEDTPVLYVVITSYIQLLSQMVFQIPYR